MQSRSTLALLLILIGLIAGCASTTQPGQIGVTRNQLLIVPAVRIEALAGESYAKATTEARTAGKLNTDEVLTSRVKRIAGRLIREVGVYRPDARGWDWQVNVIDSNQMNAFCMPGGRIVVYSGLIRRLDLSDAEVAGAIGHEIAHALREHSREKMSQQVLSNAVVQGIASSSQRSPTATGALAQIGAQLLIHLPFSRDMEIEADAMGLELAARAGYDPAQASNIWRKMQLQSGAGIEFLSTHPSHERRIAELEALVQKVAYLYRPQAGESITVMASSNMTSTPAAGAPTAAVEPTNAVASSLVPSRNRIVLAPNDSGIPMPKVTGQDGISAEKLAKSQSCMSEPRATLAAKGPGFESYAVPCTNGDTLMIRCEFGNCRVLK